MARLRIAPIVTEYRTNAHAQHIVDRFLVGYCMAASRLKPMLW